MTGLCIVWGIKKYRARETFSCCDCQSRNSAGFLKVLKQLGAASKCAQSWWEQGFSYNANLTLTAVSNPYASVAAELKPWQNPRTAALSLLALQLCLEQRLSFLTLSPPKWKPWLENLQKQPERYFLSFLWRRAEEWQRRGKGLYSWFFSFPFCNTSCCGECLVLLMLSGSGNYCGSRSLVICCFYRRHGSAEPELFIQPSRSS